MDLQTVQKNLAISKIIELTNISISYGDFVALKEITFDVNKNDLIAIVGQSGAGKTTLLSIINGVIVPTQGMVKVFGEDINYDYQLKRRAQKKIGVVYQDLELVDSLRVIHNVNVGHLGEWPFFKALWSLGWPLGVDKAHDILLRLRIGEKIFEKTANLSRGQKQRVAIARVLTQDPDILILDEPVSSLDARSAREILELVCGLNADFGKTVIASLHSIELALEFFNRIIGLKNGELVFDLPTPAITPKYIQELLS